MQATSFIFALAFISAALGAETSSFSKPGRPLAVRADAAAKSPTSSLTSESESVPHFHGTNHRLLRRKDSLMNTVLAAAASAAAIFAVAFLALQCFKAISSASLGSPSFRRLAGVNKKGACEPEETQETETQETETQETENQEKKKGGLMRKVLAGLTLIGMIGGMASMIPGAQGAPGLATAAAGLAPAAAAGPLATTPLATTLPASTTAGVVVEVVNQIQEQERSERRRREAGAAGTTTGTLSAPLNFPFDSTRDNERPITFPTNITVSMGGKGPTTVPGTFDGTYGRNEDGSMSRLRGRLGGPGLNVPVDSDYFNENDDGQWTTSTGTITVEGNSAPANVTVKISGPFDGGNFNGQVEATFQRAKGKGKGGKGKGKGRKGRGGPKNRLRGVRGAPAPLTPAPARAPRGAN